MMLQEIFSEEIKMFQRYAEEKVRSWSKHALGSLFKDFFLSTGKRMRPSIALASAEIVGGEAKSALPAALAVELIHASSLIHDDIIDMAAFRRGKIAFHKRYGLTTAILLADFVLSEVVRSILNIPDLKKMRKVFAILSHATKILCEGEYLDSISTVGNGFNEEDYLRVAFKKTAELFKASAVSGGILGGGSQKELQALRSYGLNLGVAFQIKDDILDFSNNSLQTGKDSLRDLVLGRPSYPLLLKRKGLSLEEALKRASEKTLEYTRKALNSLNTFTNCQAKEKLIKLAEFNIERMI